MAETGLFMIIYNLKLNFVYTSVQCSASYLRIYIGLCRCHLQNILDLIYRTTSLKSNNHNCPFNKQNLIFMGSNTVQLFKEIDDAPIYSSHERS